MNSQSNLNQQCLICASKRINIMRNYAALGLVKCKECGFVFMHQIPTKDELDKHYSTYGYEGERVLTPMTVDSYNSTLDEFESYRKTNKLLDIGCGVGHFPSVARQKGWESFGTEYSPKAVAHARKKGINMHIGPLQTATFDAESFDVITSFEVIEHLNNPIEEINTIYRLLRPGGIFYCTTPNFNSLLRYWLKTDYKVIEYPEHLSYYTKKTLTKLMIANGFKLVKFKSTGFSLTQIQRAKNQLKEDFTFKTSSDENLRRKIQENRWLGMVKKIANFLLTQTNTGMILKGYYKKPD